MRRFRFLFLAVSAACVLCTAASAQDAHYWNLHYGTRSTLLGGAVIGSVEDLSATFYNPGALGLSREGGLILSANVYDVNFLALKGTGEYDRTASSFAFTPAPSLVAGRLSRDSTDVNRLSYSLITRQRSNYTLRSRNVENPESLPGFTGPVEFSNETIAEQSLSDIWAGVTWSRALSPAIGVGVTVYGTFRTQSRRVSNGVVGLDSIMLRSYGVITDFDYYHVGLALKAGISLDYGDWSAGATVTTPRLGLFGSGSSSVEARSSGFDTDGNGTPDDFLAADYQEDLSSGYQSPFSVGAGVAYRTGAWRFDFSAEWFSAVKQFTMLSPAPFVGQSTGTTYAYEVWTSYEPVFNYGFGAEYRSGPKNSWFLSVIRDHSAASTASTIAMVNLDFTHVTGGTMFTLGAIRLTLGAGWMFGSGQLPKTDEGISKELLESISRTFPDLSLTSTRLRLLFAFSYDV
jgi:hypothetical protein